MTYRIISETRASYLLEKAGATHTFDKHLCKSPFYVGDWVEDKRNQLTLVKRDNIVSKASNATVKNYRQKPTEQVLATNVDQIIIVIALDQNFSLAKLERFYLVFYQEGINLHFILTKIDLVPDYQTIISQVKTLYPQIKLTAINNLNPDVANQVSRLFSAGQTVLFLGASGAGKSTLINHLLGHKTVKTNSTRSDGKGRHTTTSSLLLDCPAYQVSLIDTPGFKGIDKVKELDLSPLYQEIVSLSQLCHFPNCQHKSEPKCAVKSALATGELSHALWERYAYHCGKS